VIEADVIPIDFEGLPGGTGEAKRFVIAKGNARQLVYFWYQSRGRAIARNHDVILYRFLDRAMRRRTDGSLVRLTVPIWQEDEAGAEAELDRFTSEFVPKLDGYIPN
jgi:EpsI family protein